MPASYDMAWLIERRESGDKLKFLYFWGHTDKYDQGIGKFCFSQWFESPFVVDGIVYKTAEHWMMAQKALLFGDKAVFDGIVRSEKPGEAKALGRQVANFREDAWDQKKFDLVRLGNLHKFSQHPALAKYLLKTGDRIIVEASPVDTVWGIGLAPDDKDIDHIDAWRGQNLLGFALMEVRDALKGSVSLSMNLKE